MKRLADLESENLECMWEEIKRSAPPPTPPFWLDMYAEIKRLPIPGLKTLWKLWTRYQNVADIDMFGPSIYSKVVHNNRF